MTEMCTLYVIGGQLFGKKVGLIAAFLYSVLPLPVYYDQKYWNPSTVPLLNLLIIYSVFLAKKNQYWLILFAVASGLVFHVHLSLVPSVMLGGVILITQKVYKNRKAVMLAIIAFLITVSPLIMFDYFHKYSNISVIFRLKQISSTETTQVNPIFKLKTFLDFLGRIWYLKPGSSNSDEILFACTSSSMYKTPKTIDKYSSRTTATPILIFASLFFVLFSLLNKKTWLDYNRRLIVGFFLATLFAFLFFPGNSFEYYLLGLLPIYFLIVGLFADSIKQTSYPYKAVISVLIIAGSIGLLTILKNDNQFGIAAKKKLIQAVMGKLNGESYELSSGGMCHKFEGWRYLFATYGKKPNKSSTDITYGWLYPNEINKQPPKYLVIVHESRALSDLNTSGTKAISVGGFSAYISEE